MQQISPLKGKFDFPAIPFEFSELVKLFEINESFLEKETAHLKGLLTDENLLPKVLNFLALSVLAPKEDIGDAWFNYIVRIPEWKNLYNNYSQEEYGKEMHQSIRIGAIALQNDYLNYDELLSFLSNRRQIIAINMGFSRWREVGRIGLVVGKMTSCGSQYSEIPKLLFQNLQSSYDQKEGCTWYDKGNYLAHLNGRIHRLSFFENFEKPLTFRGLYSTPINGVIQHTSPKECLEVMNYVKLTLFPQAMAEENPDTLLEYLGQIFWLICQAKPWHLGDPSIAESLIRTIWISKGFKNVSWQKNVIPWIEVMIEPDINKFAAKFCKFFEDCSATKFSVKD